MKVPARKKKEKSEIVPLCDLPRRLIDQTAVGGVASLPQLDEERNERMRNELEARARELAGPSPTPLLQTMALTVALCEHDLRARQAVDGPTTSHELRQRLLDRSMRRYLEACKTLAQIRKQDRPSIQLNLAENQIVTTAGLDALRSGRR